VTRQQQHKTLCPKCGASVDTHTPFSQWLRQLEAPLDSANCDCQNLDYIWFHYRPGWFITIEEKRFGATQSRAQGDTQAIIAQMLAIASGAKVETIRGIRAVGYRGHYVVSFEKTTPEDSEWVEINGIKHLNVKEVILLLLKNGNPEGSPDKEPKVLQFAPTELTNVQIASWLNGLPPERLMDMIAWAANRCKALAANKDKVG
jgi:hypothetical protein